MASYLYGKDPQDLSQEQKDTITSIITLGTAGIAYGATGDVGSAVSASEVGKVGVEWNGYVPLSAMQGKTRAEVERLYNSNISYFDANCVKSSANCNSIIDHMIKFADSDYVALNYPHLRDRTVRLLRDNPQAVERYFNNKVAQFNAKDRSILNMYLLPSLEVAGGVAGVGGSVAGVTYACAQTAGFGCYAAAVAGSAGLTSSIGHVVTGSRNIGKPLSQQDSTAFVQFLKSQGLSETTASNLQLAIDVFGTGGIGYAVRTGAKAGNSSSAKTSRTKEVDRVKVENNIGRDEDVFYKPIKITGEPKDLKEYNDASKFTYLNGGGEFKFSETKNQQGIEGYFVNQLGDKIPVSLKNLETSSPRKVMTVINKNAKSILEAEVLPSNNPHKLPIGTLNDTVLHIQTPNISKQQLVDELTNYPFQGNGGKYKIIIFETKDGGFTLQNGKIESYPK